MRTMRSKGQGPNSPRTGEFAVKQGERMEVGGLKLGGQTAWPLTTPHARAHTPPEREWEREREREGE